MAAKPPPKVAPAASDWPCLKPWPGGCQLDVSVVPNARRTAADGWHDGALRLRLNAPPVDGKANAQLIDWLADELGCPKRRVTLLRGDTARRKQLAIELPLDQVANWLDRLGLARDG